MIKFDVERLDPRVHGNGFIQCDLDSDTRLHVWGHPAIPRQKVNSPIHDHIFGFHSTCLVGRLVNVVYFVFGSDTGGAFNICEAQPPVTGHDSKLVVQKHLGTSDIYHKRTDVLLSGRSYDMKPYEFHETFASEPTVTLMQKHVKTIKDHPTPPQKPRVLVPVDMEPDNEFDRHTFGRDFLMDIIKEVIG